VSFRIKTILGIALIETVLLIILISSVLFFIKTSHNKEVNQRASSTAHLFAAMTKDGVLATDLATLDNFVSEILDNDDIIYAKVIGDNMVLAQGGDSHILEKPFSADKNLTNVNDGIFDVFAPITEGGYTYGRVELGFSTARIQDVLVQTRQWTISLAIIEISLVAIFSFLLGTWLTSQLVILKQASETIGAKGPGHQVNVKGNDEVAQVALAFNQMSESLWDSYQELENKSNAFSKVAELANRSQAHNANIIASSLDGMLTIDNTGTIIEYNPAAEQIFGYKREQAIGADMSELIIPEKYRKHHRRGLDIYLKTGKGSALNKRLELEGLHKNGQVFPIELTISALDNHDTVLFTAFIRDITQTKLAEQKLIEAHKEAQQASEAKSQFLATMSHEIRTPMNVLIGTIGLLKDSPLNSEQQKFIQTADDSASALLNLLNDILDFSKIEANKLNLESEVFSLNDVLDAVTGIFSNKAKQQKISLSQTVDMEVPQYYCSDAGRLQQVLLNLVSNAIKFTKQGKVAISVSKKAQCKDIATLLFEIEDTGIGIKETDQTLLFQEFSQIDHLHNRSYEGSGLGLAICKKLVALFSGQIGLTSQPGKGSKFWFTVKLQVEQNAPKVRTFPENELIQPLNILLAEDSQANVVVACAVLKKAGHQVKVAKNGYESIQMLNQSLTSGKLFDLVLMDLMMPKMDGIEATKIIRNMPQPINTIPIIAMTANAMSSDKKACFKAGMNDYISKPFLVNDLMDKMALQFNNNKQAITSVEQPVDMLEKDSPIMDNETLDTLAKDTSKELLPEMIEVFLNELKKRQENLIRAFKCQDEILIAGEVHALKSSSGAFGAKKLQLLANKIDSLYKAKQNTEDFHIELLTLIKTTIRVYSEAFFI